MGVMVPTRSTDRTVEGVGWMFFSGALLVALVIAVERVAAALATTYRARNPTAPSLAVIDDAVVVKDGDQTTLHAR